ncbi:MAG: hypothetical protein HZB50_07785 [Chloroflexi bacterium]|nr:hypothetical protein [Chloroflexota bacterium]
MKVIFRILVILVAASLIGGAIVALVNVSGTGSQQNSFRPSEGNRQFNPDDNLGFRPDSGGREDHERGGGGILGLGFGLLKNMLVIAVIAILYFNATKWFGKPKVKE